jgi:hypothetical protein
MLDRQPQMVFDLSDLSRAMSLLDKALGKREG